jgi:PAS domain S-box-containing protein
MNRHAWSTPFQSSAMVAAVGFLVLLLGLQWTAHQGRRHLTVASQSLFPAALATQQAAVGFDRMTNQYRDAFLLEQDAGIQAGTREGQAVLSSLRNARQSMSFHPVRERQIASLIVRTEQLQARSVFLYSTAIAVKDKLSPELAKRIGDLGHENEEVGQDLRKFQSDIADDFTSHLQLTQKWWLAERIFGLVLFVVIVATLFVTVTKLVEVTAKRRSDEALREAHRETELLLNSVTSLLIGLDPAGKIRRWNRASSAILGWDEAALVGKTLGDCGVKWLLPDVDAQVAAAIRDTTRSGLNDVSFERAGTTHFLGLKAIPLIEGDGGGLVVGADITEKMLLEGQLRQAHKLEAIGQLAAGIAHEINTPTQFVTNNATFLQESWNSIDPLLQLAQAIQKELSDTGSVSTETRARLSELWQQSDLDYLRSEVPTAIEQSLEGLQRVANIVRAMKEFSHPGSKGRAPVDINRAIETTIAVARNEWKYVAEVSTNFATDLPLVPCVGGEFNQVILNLLVNAAQAIAALPGERSKDKGKITISTRRCDKAVEIAIQDTGTGIPENIRSRIFDPFFTTKPVGKGTGQGLSLAHSTIVKRGNGKIWFESEVGAGTTFFIQLPLEEKSFAAAPG